jgi:hypothetical protein
LSEGGGRRRFGQGEDGRGSEDETFESLDVVCHGSAHQYSLDADSGDVAERGVEETLDVGRVAVGKDEVGFVDDEEGEMGEGNGLSSDEDAWMSMKGLRRGKKELVEKAYLGL